MQELFGLFGDMGYPYYRQGSVADDDYDPAFFTFWNIDTPQDAHYDGKLTRYHEYVQIGFYTNDATKIYSVMDDFIERAKSKGFVIAGMPQDANADKDDYFGRICYIRIIHNSKEG